MPLDKEKRLSLAIVAAIVVAQAVVVAPELSMAAWRDNDSINHYTMTAGMVQAVEHGENPLDFWSPEVSLGVPMARTYQPLAHILVAAAYFALGKSVPLMTVLVWARYLAIVLLPVTMYFAMLLLEFPPLTAAAGALLLPMVAGTGQGFFGMDLRTWMGFGVYPQNVATHLLLLAIGLSFQAIRKGKRVAVAGAAIGLTFLTHFILGWIAALTAGILALMPDRETPRLPRIRRTAALGAVALVLTAFQLAPLFKDGYLINHSRTEPPAKFDSVGAPLALSWLLTGEVMDHERLPVLSLLSLAGAALLVWRWRKTRKLAPAERFILLGFVFWLLVFFGRPTWGVLLLLIGATRDLHLHRVFSAVQLFMLMLAAVGFAALWREVGRRWNTVAAAIVAALLLTPLAIERYNWVQFHEGQSRETLAAVQAEGPALDQALALAIRRGGRLYPGLPTNWGLAFKLGYTPVAALAALHLAPEVSVAYNNSVLAADVMYEFNELNPVQYRLFDIRTVIVPAAAPGFLTPVAQFGRFRVLDAPGAGYFGLVDVAATAGIDRDSFFDLNKAWLQSEWPEKNQYIQLDFGPDPAPKGMRLSPGSPIPAPPNAAAAPGSVTGERQTRQVYEADLDVARPSYALFRMSYHPCWKAYIDGVSQPTVMLSPGFLGVAVTPGRHHILCRYEPGNWKVLMSVAGFAIVGLLIAGEQIRARRRA